MVSGGWVKSYLRDRIECARALMGVTPQSSLFISVLWILISLLQIQVPCGPLPGRSRVFPGRLFFSYGIIHILKKFAPRLRKKEPPRRLH